MERRFDLEFLKSRHGTPGEAGEIVPSPHAPFKNLELIGPKHLSSNCFELGFGVRCNVLSSPPRLHLREGLWDP